jgi:hypothetical protein
VSDQGRADTALVMLGPDGQRAEHVHLNQSPRGVEQTVGEHDVPDDLPVEFSDQYPVCLTSDRRPSSLKR